MGEALTAVAAFLPLYAGRGRGFGRGAEDEDVVVEMELSAGLGIVSGVWMLDICGRVSGVKAEMWETTDRSAVKFGVCMIDIESSKRGGGGRGALASRSVKSGVCIDDTIQPSDRCLFAEV